MTEAEMLANSIDPRNGAMRLAQDKDGRVALEVRLIAASDALRQSATVRALALEEAKSALDVELGKINGTLAGIMGREDTPKANFSQLRFNLTLAKQSYEDALNLVSALSPTHDLEAMVERGARAANQELKRQFGGHPVAGVPLYDPDNWTATGGMIDLSAIVRAVLAAVGFK